jgi:hypothetical protein
MYRSYQQKWQVDNGVLPCLLFDFDLVVAGLVLLLYPSGLSTGVLHRGHKTASSPPPSSQSLTLSLLLGYVLLMTFFVYQTIMLQSGSLVLRLQPVLFVYNRYLESNNAW